MSFLKWAGIFVACVLGGGILGGLIGFVLGKVDPAYVRGQFPPSHVSPSADSFELAIGLYAVFGLAIGFLVGCVVVVMGALRKLREPQSLQEAIGSNVAAMDEGAFWQIIERNQGNAERVARALAKLPAPQIAAFAISYDNHLARLHRWDVWGAAYVINQGCGDDGFHYFKAWIIGKGRKAYETALSDPDSLGPHVSKREAEEGCENEMLNYAADMAYERVARTGEALERSTNEAEEPAGEPWEEDEVDTLFPKLSAKFQ